MTVETPSSFDFSVYVNDIYHCTLVRLKAADIDQEVKERAISCMGQIITNLGDHLQAELAVCFPIFLDRLRNEITRLTTVKALTKIAGSPLKIDLRPVLVSIPCLQNGNHFQCLILMLFLSFAHHYILMYVVLIRVKQCQFWHHS